MRTPSRIQGKQLARFQAADPQRGGVLARAPCPGQSDTPAPPRSRGWAYQTLQSSWMVALGGYRCPPWRQGHSSGGTQRSFCAEAGTKGHLGGLPEPPPAVSDSPGARPVPCGRAGPAVPRAAPSRTYQQHGARGTDTAPCAVRGAGVVGTRAVTGEKAGTRDIDKVTRAECLLGAAAVSRAIPETPLLADTAEDGRQVRGRPPL